MNGMLVLYLIVFFVAATILGSVRPQIVVESLSCGGERRPSVLAYRVRQRALEQRFDCPPWFSKTSTVNLPMVNKPVEPGHAKHFAFNPARFARPIGDARNSVLRLPPREYSRDVLRDKPPIVQKPEEAESEVVPLDTFDPTEWGSLIE